MYFHTPSPSSYLHVSSQQCGHSGCLGSWLLLLKDLFKMLIWILVRYVRPWEWSSWSGGYFPFSPCPRLLWTERRQLCCFARQSSWTWLPLEPIKCWKNGLPYSRETEGAVWDHKWHWRVAVYGCSYLKGCFWGFSMHLPPFWAFVLSSALFEMQIKAMIHIQTIWDLYFRGLCWTFCGVSFQKLILVENY